jgi:hypothetical protein
MNNTIKTLLVLTLIITGISILIQPVKGVVVLDGYSHGVVICGDEKDDAERIVDDEFTAYVYMGNTVIINAGHDTDTQVNDLLTLATKVCAQY